jgi:AcrR family transcriptional regulator
VSVDNLTTKDRILIAGLRLFGDQGYAAASMRAITDAAGVNIASVNYHFGGKDGLFRAVTAFAIAEVNAERARLLDALEARATPPTAGEIIDAFVSPGTTIAERSDGLGPLVAQFLGRVICEPRPEVRRLFGDEVAPVEGRYLRALERALPELSEDEVEFRYRAMVGLLALHQSGSLTDLAPGRRDPATERSAEACRLREAVHRIFTP